MELNSHLLGDLLVSMGFISRQQLEEALQFQQVFIEETLPELDLERSELVSRGRKGGQQIPMLGQILVDKRFVTQEQLVPALDIQAKRTKDLSRLDRDKLATALEVGLIINSTIDLVEVLSLIMKYATLVTDSMASTLMLLDEKTGELVFSVPTGPSSHRLKDVRIPPGVGIAGWVAENDQPVRVTDTQKESRFYGEIDAMTGIKTHSLLCVPMKSKRKLIGVLEVINKKNNACFTEEDTLLLNLFSHQAAMAIENAMLYSSMQKGLEKEKQIARRVIESERLRSLGTLAGGIAHDFNNILGAIMGYTELALMDAAKESKQFANLHKVLGASARAKALIGQIQIFSRQSQKEIMPIQVKAIVNEALELLRASLPKTIEIQEHLVSKAMIMGDPTQIHQVVMNLVTNAGQAMKQKGGALAVSLEQVLIDPQEARNHPLEPGPYLRLRVKDSGEGMLPQVMERIFEPFFSTREQHQGTGMGLAVVHGIVKNHGGDIQVASEPGKGSVFEVWLPVIEPDTGRVSPASGLPPL